MKPVRVAFCGCGRISVSHAKELARIPGVHLRACWNRTTERAESLAREFGADYVAADFDRIAADPAVDAVYINTMHNDRRRILRAMADAGKPVFMEKPLTHSPETLREMHRLLRSKPVLFQSGYKIRFHSLVRKARELLPRPEFLEAHVLDETWPEGHLNDLNVTGANVRSQGVYATDVLHILAGSPPVSVTAMAGCLRQRSGAEDTLAAAFEFANGAIGMAGVADAGVVADPVSKFLVVATGGNCSVALFDRYKRLDFNDVGRKTTHTFSGEEDGFLRQSESFIAAVRGEGKIECDFLMGAIPSIMIYSALDAAKSGTRVKIDAQAWLDRD